MTLDRRGMAVNKLAGYFKMIYEKVGMEWTEDDDQKISEMIDDIIQAGLSVGSRQGL